MSVGLSLCSSENQSKLLHSLPGFTGREGSPGSTASIPYSWLLNMCFLILVPPHALDPIFSEIASLASLMKKRYVKASNSLCWAGMLTPHKCLSPFAVLMFLPSDVHSFESLV